jgi:hypothetical protein
MADIEDERLGHLLRAIRRRAGQRQKDLAADARVPRRDLVLIGAGEAGKVRLERVRRVFAEAGGRARLTVWWNGAAADRLLDGRHAALVERALGVLESRGWKTQVEVTFSEFGERGSIDILAGHTKERAVAVCEVKTVVGSLEETNRILDVKERLGPRVAVVRLGWAPRVTGRILIVPDESTMRRIVARHAMAMASAYPARSREVRAWLRKPDRPLRGMWFLSDGRMRHGEPD